jgi:hypothetical protein
MPDISLKRYDVNANTSAYNAPHKYRFALKKGMLTKPTIDSWNRDKQTVLNELVEEIKEIKPIDSVFIYACAPSRTQIFIKDIRNVVRETFVNAIDLTDCFSKLNDFDAGTERTVLTREQLRECITLDEACYRNKVSSKIDIALLLDDVYSTGNTLNGMRYALEALDDSLEIKTAVILTTT